MLNNLEFDHADIFDDLAAIERQFHHLVRTVPPSGRVVVNGLEESLARVLHAGCWSGVASFGAAVSDFCARGEPHDFEVLQRGEPVARVQWELTGHAQPAQRPGGDRRRRACGRGARAGGRGTGALRERAPPHGAARQVGGISVYDDFAHHPTALRTTLDGLRRSVGPQTRLLAVFRAAQQHHEAGHHEGAAALGAGGGRPGLLPHRRAGLGCRRSPGADGRAGQHAADITTLVADLVAQARPGDHIVCMSNGSFGGMHAKLLDALSKQ